MTSDLNTKKGFDVTLLYENDIASLRQETVTSKLDILFRQIDEASERMQWIPGQTKIYLAICASGNAYAMADEPEAIMWFLLNALTVSPKLIHFLKVVPILGLRPDQSR